MRGKVKAVLCGFVGGGITPAHAGKSSSFAALRFAAWDHPRACGEKLMALRMSLSMRGSPPRMRGKASGADAPDAVVRITPAHAGKSSNNDYKNSDVQDHPRACGEKLPTRAALLLSPGSPPRMRGKVVKCCHGVCSFGITPAHAGKSGLNRILQYTGWDHPRACGEKTKKIP